MQSIASIEKTSMRELTRRWWKWEAAGVVFIIVGIAISWFVFVELAHWRFSWGGDAVYWLSPNAVVW